MLLLTQASLISFLFVSCAPKKPTEIFVPAARGPFLEAAECKARAFIQLQDRLSDASVKAPATLHFQYSKEASNFEILFYSPFGTRVGHLKLEPNHSVWRDSNGEQSLDAHPVFGQWYRENWEAEIAFLLGILTPSNWSSTQVDENQRLRRLTFSDRQINCDYMRPADEKNCKLEMASVTGSVRIKDMECSREYETETRGDPPRRKEN